MIDLGFSILSQVRGEIEQATKRIERYGEELAQISTKKLAKSGNPLKKHIE